MFSFQICLPGSCRDVHHCGLQLPLIPPAVYSKGLILNICIVDGSSERGEKDASKITTYPPGAVRFDCELRAVQVSCGFHHSGMLISFTLILRIQNQDGLLSLLDEEIKKMGLFLLCSGADGKWRCLHIRLWAAWAARTWRCQLQVCVGKNIWCSD